MFGRKASPPQVGDRYMKADDRLGKVWEVSRLWTTVDGVPHARLVNRDETLAVSVGTLSDPKFFMPVPSMVSVTE